MKCNRNFTGREIQGPGETDGRGEGKGGEDMGSHIPRGDTDGLYRPWNRSTLADDSTEKVATFIPNFLETLVTQYVERSPLGVCVSLRRRIGAEPNPSASKAS